MQARTALAALSLSLCFAWSGEVAAAPPGTVKGASTKAGSPTATPTPKSAKGAPAKSPSAKPAPKSKAPPKKNSGAKNSSVKGASADGKPKGKQAKPKGKSKATSFKRKSFKGAPVLRSRKTPGHTKTRRGASETTSPPTPTAAAAAGATIIDAKVMQSLLSSMAPKQVWFDSGHLDQGNVWVEFDGTVRAKRGTFQTNSLKIFYPIPMSLGKYLHIRCWHYPSNATRTVAVVSDDKDGNETTWDEISVSPGKKKLADGTTKTKWTKDFEVVIDTKTAAIDESKYRIEISANKQVLFWGCVLNRMD